MRITSLWRVTLRAAQDWWEDNCLRLAASLAYYTAPSKVCDVRADCEAREPDAPDGTRSRERGTRPFGHSSAPGRPRRPW
jgi:hypothetical protein